MAEQPKVPAIGDSVTYVDQVSREIPAIVTDVHIDGTPFPSINLAFVSLDDAAQDQYGRQLVRETSVVHQEKQSAKGFFWKERQQGLTA